MTKKQREELKYISGWIFGISYQTEQAVAEGLIDISECLNMLLREDENGENV